MRDGVIEQQGTPLDLFERPATKYVAGFLGSPSMNFVEARLVASGDTLGVLLDDGTALALPPARAAKLASHRDETIILGLRPEYMTRAHPGDTRVGVALHTATIELLQPTGSRTYATFRLGNADVVAELQAHDVTAINEKVELAFDMNRAVLIDAGTEKVI
jgi:multiple sugar transport system ATP-binding protein